MARGGALTAGYWTTRCSEHLKEPEANGEDIKDTPDPPISRRGMVARMRKEFARARQEEKNHRAEALQKLSPTNKRLQTRQDEARRSDPSRPSISPPLPPKYKSPFVD
ncbi:hypothetical protein AAMO2058_000652000 [Amorphochlora amoebiformis]